MKTHAKQQLGFRTFSNSAPRLWNAPPQALRESESSSAFRRNLKIHLFSNQWAITYLFLCLWISLFITRQRDCPSMCATSIAVPWMFGRATNWQYSSLLYTNIGLRQRNATFQFFRIDAYAVLPVPASPSFAKHALRRIPHPPFGNRSQWFENTPMPPSSLVTE